MTTGRFKRRQYMIVSTLYRCDNCLKEKTAQGSKMPEGWKWFVFKGDFCPSCARIEGQRIKNLSQGELRKELEAFPMSQLRRLRGPA
jgi:hypothetical protein